MTNWSLRLLNLNKERCQNTTVAKNDQSKVTEKRINPEKRNSWNQSLMANYAKTFDISKATKKRFTKNNRNHNNKKNGKNQKFTNENHIDD